MNPADAVVESMQHLIDFAIDERLIGIDLHDAERFIEHLREHQRNPNDDLFKDLLDWFALLTKNCNRQLNSL